MDESHRVSSLKICAIALLALCMFTLAGCATSYDRRGVYYKMRSTDTIWQVAKAYRIDVQQLAEYNNILDPDNVQPGTKLYIPPATRKAFKKLPFGTAVVSSRSGGKYSRGGDSGGSRSIQVYRGKFDWPIVGRFGSPFGMRNGRRHDGIDISADTGTPIHASAPGKVVFAGQMRGYGNLVLVRHEGDFFTAYAHNSKNKVREGQEVKRGQVIAEVGRTGRATAPHLHFEIRHGQTARNPLFFLPEHQAVASRDSHPKKR